MNLDMIDRNSAPEELACIWQSKGAFQKSELAGQTMAGAAFWQWNRFFPTVVAEKPSPSCIVFRIWRIWLDSFDEK